MNAQAAEERRARELELALEQKQLESMKREEDEFQQYAAQIIKQAENAQRNPFPLKVWPNLHVFEVGNLFPWHKIGTAMCERIL